MLTVPEHYAGRRASMRVRRALQVCAYNASEVSGALRCSVGTVELVHTMLLQTAFNKHLED
eukprot:1907295-Pleurochrysis_carterae.AAC.1